MMKLILFGLVGLFSLLATIVASLAVTGNLSQEKLRGLWDKEALAEAQAAQQAEEAAEQGVFDVVHRPAAQDPSP